MGNPWMATMQGLGILAALLTLSISVPAAARLARLDPMGQHAAFVDRLRKRQRLVGLITLAMGLLALLAWGDVPVRGLSEARCAGWVREREWPRPKRAARLTGCR